MIQARDWCPCWDKSEIRIMGFGVTQSGVIFTGVVVTIVLVIAYRLYTRRKRYHS